MNNNGKESGHPTATEAERAILVGVRYDGAPEWRVKDSLEELGRLVTTAGGKVVGQTIVTQRKAHPGHLIGSGKAGRIAEYVVEQKADTVVFDDELTPAQGRNLERLTASKVVDRTQVILDIFGLHAHTREGVLQVELARLSYLLPRLRRMWTHLERQKGGIGLRGGPGEQQIEVDRRIVMNKMNRIREELREVSRHRRELRRGRRRHGWATTALVGYTNAGKSTLLNQLAGPCVETADALFVTLDTTTRKIDLPSQRPVLLSDTVGFIEKLPHQLIEAFKATLDEVVEADLLIHVVDASSERADEQIDAVQRVLEELEIAHKPSIMALNKVDTPMGRAQVGRLQRLHEHPVALSALTGSGLDNLLHLVADRLREKGEDLFLRIPHNRAHVLAGLKARLTPLEEYATAEACLVRAHVPAPLQHLYNEYAIDTLAWNELLNRQERITVRQGGQTAP